jgi:nucleotide-binding universal stress UspA family protein
MFIRLHEVPAATLASLEFACDKQHTQTYCGSLQSCAGTVSSKNEVNMALIDATISTFFKNILYLTDFSQPSKTALPFAAKVARKYGAEIHALHVLGSRRHYCSDPDLSAAFMASDEEIAQTELAKLDSALAGISHEVSIVRGTEIWPAAEKAIREYRVDLLVLGTHGRTGPLKHRLGSVAEELFRRSPVPVLTVGPNVYSSSHNDAGFRRVLFATDFEPESDAAAHFAVAIAQESKAQLILLHVLDTPRRGWGSVVEPTIAEIMHELYEMIPKGAELLCRSDALVKYGNPYKQIVETAKERCAELIVLGARSHADSLAVC